MDTQFKINELKTKHGIDFTGGVAETIASWGYPSLADMIDNEDDVIDYIYNQERPSDEEIYIPPYEEWDLENYFTLVDLKK